MKKIIESIKGQLKPTKKEEEKTFALINNFLKMINKNLKGAKAIIGGSGAKGTWLKDAHDSDIFVLYDFKKYVSKSDQLSDILEKHLKKIFKKISRIHGSRDYFQIKVKEHTFEIIPILKISKAEQAMNLTDISPLHTRWVKKYKKYADDIRLTKKFCKAARVYGAESYINGFSGYVCEILTIYYKSFINLVKAAPKWNEKVYIDIDKHHKNIEMEVNKSKLVSPLILIDPVQYGRNASAALSKEKFDLFRKACKKFLQKPNKNFFIEEEIDIMKLRKKYKKKLISIFLTPPNGKKDIIGTKLLKSYNFLKKSIDDYGFIVKEADWEWDKRKSALFYFIFKDISLPRTYEWPGPPVKMKFNVKKFKNKYKKTVVKGNKIFAIVERKITDAKSYIKFLLKNGYLKDKIRKVDKID